MFTVLPPSVNDDDDDDDDDGDTQTQEERAETKAQHHWCI